MSGADVQALGSLCYHPGEAALHVLIEAARDEVDDLSGFELAQVLWAVGELGLCQEVPGSASAAALWEAVLASPAATQRICAGSAATVVSAFAACVMSEVRTALVGLLQPYSAASPPATMLMR